MGDNETCVYWIVWTDVGTHKQGATRRSNIYNRTDTNDEYVIHGERQRHNSWLTGERQRNEKRGRGREREVQVCRKVLGDQVQAGRGENEGKQMKGNIAAPGSNPDNDSLGLAHLMTKRHKMT